MVLRILLALAILLTPALARADYQLCTVRNGAPTQCSGWYQGWVVMQVDGVYRSCRVVNGEARGCGMGFTGPAPLRVYGEIRRCTFVNGYVSKCGDWFQGRTAVWR